MQVTTNESTLSAADVRSIASAADGLGLHLEIDGNWREQEGLSTGAAAHLLLGERVMSVHLSDLSHLALFALAVREALGLFGAAEVLRDLVSVTGHPGDYCLRHVLVRGSATT